MLVGDRAGSRTGHLMSRRSVSRAVPFENDRVPAADPDRSTGREISFNRQRYGTDLAIRHSLTSTFPITIDAYSCNNATSRSCIPSCPRGRTSTRYGSVFHYRIEITGPTLCPDIIQDSSPIRMLTFSHIFSSIFKYRQLYSRKLGNSVVFFCQMIK